MSDVFVVTAVVRRGAPHSFGDARMVCVVHASHVTCEAINWLLLLFGAMRGLLLGLTYP